jgi:2-desacetyl-2-hydroxyethyl bacteriochlorophyllide A dehydrogenase
MGWTLSSLVQMRAVTFQAPGEVRVDERPDPEPVAPGDAVVRVEATGICGSDLHIYHGRVAIEPGFVIGHEYVGTVVAAGDGVSGVAVSDRVLGTYATACGGCFHCRRAEYHQCDSGRVFGHGATLGSLQGAQAELLLVPNADLTLRRVPEGLSDEVALFAGDVAGTAYHAICGDAAKPDPLEPGAAVAVLGLGPVGLCAVQVARASGASLVVAVDTVDERLRVAEALGAVAVHLTEDDPRGRVKELTGGRGVDLAVDAVGHPEALDLACRLARKAGMVSATGVYAERTEVHMGVVWIKGLGWRTGQANVIGHLDRVLAMLSAGVLDPSSLVTHHMGLDEAPEAYAIYDRREALKIVLRP